MTEIKTNLGGIMLGAVGPKLRSSIPNDIVFVGFNHLCGLNPRDEKYGDIDVQISNEMPSLVAPVQVHKAIEQVINSQNFN